MKPKVILFSDPDSLSLSLLENLLIHSCQVTVYTNKIKQWHELTRHISGSQVFSFIKASSLPASLDAHYLIYLISDTDHVVELGNAVEILSQANQLKSYLLVSSTKKGESLPRLNLKNTGIIFLNDLFGTRMYFSESGILGKLIEGASKEKTTEIPAQKIIRPVYVNDAAKQIVKWLFSFGPTGEVVEITAPPITIEKLAMYLKSIKPNFNYLVKEGETNLGEELKDHRLVTISGDLLENLKTTLQYLEQPAKKQMIKPVKPSKKRGDRQKVSSSKLTRFLYGVFIILFLAASPLLVLLVSLTSFYGLSRKVQKGNVENSRLLLTVARTTAQIAHAESSAISSLPLIGETYKSVSSLAYVLENAALVGEKSLAIMETSKTLWQKVLGKEDYDIEDYTQSISQQLAGIGETLAFTEGELKLYPRLNKLIDIRRVEKQVKEGGELVSRVAPLLGQSGKQTYLVLFQNNMELRPGGGFIGSFALVSFDAGKLVEITVSDIYSADGQLKGHVEPPGPIKKYLKEANWFLRDSNWDVDFTKNAEKAEWFLDKEINVSVDGVIALDLTVVKDLLSQIGPLNLTDYQTVITADNLYEKTQAEVEGDFFPGSTKKANYLTALTRELLNVLTQDNQPHFFSLAKVLYCDLEERHLQIYFHDPDSAESLANLNWDGAFRLPGCLGNCRVDGWGVVEANVGVNKANYFIKREYALNLQLVNGRAEKTLEITFKNTANPALGNKGTYKTYLRLITAPDANTEKIQGEVSWVSGRKEIGQYLEVLPGEIKKITFFWSDVIGEKGYLLYWRKQPGLPDDNLSLTVNGRILYNTTFEKDISWTNIP